MAVSGISQWSAAALNQSITQTPGSHKHGNHHARSNSDIDTAGSSVAAQPSSTGTIGSKLNVTV